MTLWSDGHDAIGRRVKRARLRLGTTQRELATLVGKSQGWVSQVEKGHRRLDRTTDINTLAAALHCHPNDLIGRPYAGVPAENRWQVSAAQVVRELRRYDLAPHFDGAPRSAEELWHDTGRLHRLRDAAANNSVLDALPELLREARALGEAAQSREREEAYAIYAVCCKFAHTAAHALGHPELIAMASDRAAWAAGRSADPLMPAVSAWMRVWDMWATADWDDAVALSDQAMRSVEQPYVQGDPLALRVMGALHLRAAISAARGGRPDEARQRLAAADEAALRMDAHHGPVFDRHSVTFSAANVKAHQVGVEVEMGDHARALDLARKAADTPMMTILPKSRQGHYRLDVSRALLWSGRRDKALAELEAAEKTAPQLIRNHPIARAHLARIIDAERAGTKERLRRMADRFQLN